MRTVARVSLLVVAATAVIPGIPSAALASHGWCNRTAQVYGTDGHLIHIPSVGATAASTHCLMGEGSVGDHVGNLQASLATCYGANLRDDEVFGPLTKRALEQAQTTERITSDGVYGPETRNRLKWIPACKRARQPITRYP